MKILMVTPYAPWRDGIANYALQEVARLRAAGDEVEVCSPHPSAAHFHLDLRSRRGPLALAKRVRNYDRVIVQFHPDVFLSPGMTPGRVVEQLVGLRIAAQLARRFEVRIHEVNYSQGRGSRWAKAWGWLWKEVDEIVMHTEVERDRFIDAFGVDPSRVSLAEHGSNFERRTVATRAQARANLGIDADAFTFVSIGFLQPHKGFDRALHAFGEIARPGTALHVVGSVRTDDSAFLEHASELHRLAASTPGAFVHEGYVDDVLFDTWIVAADVVVLPYRYIWSSSVIERANLYERPVIATRVGGLVHQAPAGATLVDDDAELAAAMGQAVTGKSDAITEPVTGEAHESGEPGTAPTSWQQIGNAPSLSASEVQSLVRKNAFGRRRGVVRSSAHGSPEYSAKLRQVRPITPPAYEDVSFPKAIVMRVVRKLTAWQIAPIEQTVNDLRHSAINAIESIEANESDSQQPDRSL